MNNIINNNDNIKQTICLNMIVKNECHIILNTLTKLLNKINFTYWVISDTGSTDGTQNIITSFFNSYNIPGELHQDEWKDFGYNRTIALNHAFNKTDYLLIFDADDEICGNFILPNPLSEDNYHLQFGNEYGINYTRPLLINNRLKWCFKGVLHEYLDSYGIHRNFKIIEGNYFTISGRSSNRNMDPNKYLNDAIVLEKAFDESIKNNDTLFNRYAFYCANSYNDSNNPEKAIEWYKKTLKLNGWIQEKYVSCIKIFENYNKLQQPEFSFYYLVEYYNYFVEYYYFL